MAVAAADDAGLAASAEEGGEEARRHGMASATASTVSSSTPSGELELLQGADVDDGLYLHHAVARRVAVWRRVLRRRGKRERGGGDLAWRSWRVPLSGPSSRGHVAVDVDTPDPEEEKAADGAGGGSRP
ncbi:hypothetical protein GUJ93_ZPchr0002g26077 [Zizania palustris]|uniref:Uncharacterized protein n=1 Tax=Zizania palustris TaxID=103762 RepID=A0A8J5SIC3_ZIZPA|nr:hypothetical protein GUJ93_ZPchr0002g26077 [Zizania palustris]